jgi:hypothetical protein
MLVWTSCDRRSQERMCRSCDIASFADEFGAEDGGSFVPRG